MVKLLLESSETSTLEASTVPFTQISIISCYSFRINERELIVSYTSSGNCKAKVKRVSSGFIIALTKRRTFRVSFDPLTPMVL